MAEENMIGTYNPDIARTNSIGRANGNAEASSGRGVDTSVDMDVKGSDFRAENISMKPTKSVE